MQGPDVVLNLATFSMHHAWSGSIGATQHQWWMNGLSQRQPDAAAVEMAAHAFGRVLWLQNVSVNDVMSFFRCFSWHHVTQARPFVVDQSLSELVLRDNLNKVPCCSTPIVCDVGKKERKKQRKNQEARLTMVLSFFNGAWKWGHKTGAFSFVVSLCNEVWCVCLHNQFKLCLWMHLSKLGFQSEWTQKWSRGWSWKCGNSLFVGNLQRHVDFQFAHAPGEVEVSMWSTLWSCLKTMIETVSVWLFVCCESFLFEMQSFGGCVF